jgi:hypothetical protein
VTDRIRKFGSNLRKEANELIKQRHPDALKVFLYAWYNGEDSFHKHYAVKQTDKNVFTVWKEGAGVVRLTVDPSRLNKLSDTAYRDQFKVLASLLHWYDRRYAKRLSLVLPFYDERPSRVEKLTDLSHLERCLSLSGVESRFDYLVRRLKENCEDRADEIEWSKWQRGLPGHTWKPPLKVKVTVNGSTVKVKYTEVLTGVSRCEVFSVIEEELQRLTQSEIEDLANLYRMPFY